MFICRGRSQQGEGEEAASGDQYGREEHDSAPLLAADELADALDNLPILPTWPWQGRGQGTE